MDAAEGLEVYEIAEKRDRRDTIKHEWDALLPFMHRGDLKLIQFPEYMDQRTGANIDWRSPEEIHREIEEAFGRRLP